jgi:hypothetical protein
MREQVQEPPGQSTGNSAHLTYQIQQQRYENNPQHPLPSRRIHWSCHIKVVDCRPGTGQAIRRFSRASVKAAQRNDRDARRRTVALVTVGTVRPACSLLSGHVVDEGLRFQWFSKRLGSTKNDAVSSPSKPCSWSGPHPGRPKS